MTKYKIKRNKINLGTVIKPLMRVYNKDNLDSVQIIDSKNIRLTLFRTIMTTITTIIPIVCLIILIIFYFQEI